MQSMVNFSFGSKSAFYSLPEVYLQTLPISKMKLFITVSKDIQSLTIVSKIFAEFVNPHMTTKDGTVNIFGKF